MFILFLCPALPKQGTGIVSYIIGNHAAVQPEMVRNGKEHGRGRPVFLLAKTGFSDEARACACSPVV